MEEERGTKSKQEHFESQLILKASLGRKDLSWWRKERGLNTPVELVVISEVRQKERRVKWYLPLQPTETQGLVELVDYVVQQHICREDAS